MKRVAGSCASPWTTWRTWAARMVRVGRWSSGARRWHRGLSATKMEREIEAAIDRAIYHPEWWKARPAGNWLKVTTQERDDPILRLDTFRAIDRTDKQYDADSKAKAAERQHRYRERKKLKERDAEQREAAKPWNTAGASRATWYRKRAKSSGSVGLTSSAQPEQMNAQSHEVKKCR